jgi:hypothetical protein
MVGRQRTYGLLPCLDEELTDAKHGGEEDSMIQHPLDVRMEGDGGAPKRPEIKIDPH